eukprot:2987988-Rhodomonas_salina.2
MRMNWVGWSSNQHDQPDVADCQGQTVEHEAQEVVWPVEGPSTLEIWAADLTIPLVDLGLDV